MHQTAQQYEETVHTAVATAAAPARAARRKAMAIAFTSGKGGVGKSNIAASMAVLLAQYGKRVLLVDGDLALSNIDVLFGVKPRFTLQHVIREGRSIDEALVEGPGGIRILPAGSGLQELTTLTVEQLDGLVSGFRQLDSRMDYILFDTPAGISVTVTAFLEPSNRVVLVTVPEPTALTDAYALIKVLAMRGRRAGIGVLVNQSDEHQAQTAFRGLAWVTEQFLNYRPEYLGHVPCDRLVGEAVRRQTPAAIAFPDSPMVSALRPIALKWINNEATSAAGGIEAFARDAVALISDDDHSA
ncbi:MAG: MinD/ParA family protein [Verrucomicrobia bacterium]|nr:MinD/ParA family protein [Verrucomicrobiota bacterium]